jgi:hypothetical protein
MNELEAIRFKLGIAKNIFDVVDSCKDWREILCQRIKAQFRPYQIPLSDRMIEFVLTEGVIGNEISSLWARQSGKTETVSLTTLVLGTFHITFLNEDFGCGLFAPVESMITHVTRNRVRQKYKMVKHWLEREAHIIQTAGEGYTAATFTLQNLVNDKELTIRSLSAGESASIIGETFGLLVIEQSELVDSLKLKTDIFPMGAAKGGVRIMTGTTSPYFRNEYFREAIEKWNKNPSLNKSTSDWVELVDWKEAAKVSPAYSRYVKRERDKLGEDSIEFKTQYGLEWVGTALKFVGWETLAVLEQDYQSLRERLRFFAVDPARAGDSTVVTVIELDGASIHIIGWLEMEGLDFETHQVPTIVEWLKQYQPLRYGLVDVAGLGRPVYDMLKRRLWHRPEGEEYKEWPEPWARLDSYYPSESGNDEVFKSMDREFSHKRIFYPKTVAENQKKNKAKFIEQMLDLERKYKGFTLKLEAPHIKGRHDDYPCSLAMAIFALKEKAFKAGVTYVEI